MNKGDLSLFLDTNSLLHYPAMREVNWQSVCAAKTVTLVLCMQVIHELDEKKNHSSLSQRATRVIKEIRSVVASDGYVREGVTLEVYQKTVNPSEFADDLSPESKDDRIVWYVEEYAKEMGAEAVAVYTEDLGMMLRCEGHGVAVIEPKEGTRLSDPQSDLDKKYKKAITELNDVRTQRPTLSLVFTFPDTKTPERTPLGFDLPEVPPARDIDGEVQAYVDTNRLYLMRTSDLSDSPFVGTMPHGHDAIEEYNRRLGEHLNAYRHWVEYREALEQAAAHTIRFAVWIQNSGGCPADDIDITLYLNESVFRVFETDSDDAKMFELTEPPKPPTKPRQRFVDSVASMMRSMESPLIPKFELPRLDRASIQRDEESNESTVRLSRRRLKHGDAEKLTTLIAVLAPQAIRPFHIRFRILAANQGKAVSGEIPIIVRRAADRAE